MSISAVVSKQNSPLSANKVDENKDIEKEFLPRF